MRLTLSLLNLAKLYSIRKVIQPLLTFKKGNLKKMVFCAVFLMSITSLSNAQTKHPFVAYLNEDGSRYLKFGANLQLWGRYTELNPGSKVGTNATSSTYDFVIRRLRLQALGMVTEKVFVHFQVGQNNINFTNNVDPYTAPVSVLDALGEYHFSSKLHVGAGITGWGAGVNRYSAQSSSSQLTADAPIYQQYNISSTYGNRALSIYAKGNVGKVNYCAAVTNPYRQSNNLSTVSTISPLTPNPQFLGTLTYQFLEKESIAEPYDKATYLGTKKVLNVGVGYMTQAKAMWRLSETTSDTIQEDMHIIGADIFFDSPLSENGSALTIYGSYTYGGFGKNYTRNIATPNPASSGTGSGFLGIGTGNMYYAQAGYLFRRSKNEARTARAQVYVSAEIAQLQALKTPMTMYEAGINYYITGTFGPKITLGYQNRSIFENVAGESKQVLGGRKSMVVLQYQVSF